MAETKCRWERGDDLGSDASSPLNGVSSLCSFHWEGFLPRAGSGLSRHHFHDAVSHIEPLEWSELGGGFQGPMVHWTFGSQQGFFQTMLLML